MLNPYHIAKQRCIMKRRIRRAGTNIPWDLPTDVLKALYQWAIKKTSRP